MAKLVKPLSDKALKGFKCTDKICTMYDGNGLYIQIFPNGSKLWRFSFTLNGKNRRISLGRYPDISLSLARELAQQKRGLVAKGIDPKEQEEKQKKEAQKNITIKELAIKWHHVRTKRKQVKPETLKKEFRRLELHLFPYFGDLPIQEISNKKIAQVFLNFPQSNNLYKVNQSLIQMFDFAEIEEIISVNPIKNLHSFFKYVEGRHQPTITPEDLPRLFRDIRFANNLSKVTELLLEWQLLTMLRAKEAVSVCWSDIDWETSKLVIPAERMKTGREHDVPLSKQALEILEAMKQYRHNSIFVFPTQIAPYNKSMNSQTVNNALKRIGYKNRLVSHGFRSIASTYLHELDKYSAQAIELCLAHDSRSKVQKSYDNSKKWKQRKMIMQAWGNYVEECKINALKSK